MSRAATSNFWHTLVYPGTDHKFSMQSSILSGYGKGKDKGKGKGKGKDKGKDKMGGKARR